MKNFAIIILALFTFTATVQAQDYKKSTRIGMYFYPQPENMEELPSEVNQGWVVPNVFIESDRRFLRYFTIGTETTFGWYKMTSDLYDFEGNIYNMSVELQGKLSIPFYDFLEGYAHYAIGYRGSWYSSSHQGYTQDLYVDFSARTLSLGVSVFLFDGFGLFAEAGQTKNKSFKTAGEIVESSTGYNSNNPVFDDHFENEAAYLKVGLVFSIN